MSLSKDGGALYSPKSITRNWKSLSCVTNAAFRLASGDMATCQYPLAKSIVENHCWRPSSCNESSIWDKGYTKTCGTVFLSHQHNGWRPWTVTWFNLSPFQHVCDTLLFCAESRRCKATWPTPDRPGAVYFNFMPDHRIRPVTRSPRSPWTHDCTYGEDQWVPRAPPLLERERWEPATISSRCGGRNPCNVASG